MVIDIVVMAKSRLKKCRIGREVKMDNAGRVRLERCRADTDDRRGRGRLCTRSTAEAEIGMRCRTLTSADRKCHVDSQHPSSAYIIIILCSASAWGFVRMFLVQFPRSGCSDRVQDEDVDVDMDVEELLDAASRSEWDSPIRMTVPIPSRLSAFRCGW